MSRPPDQPPDLYDEVTPDLYDEVMQASTTVVVGPSCGFGKAYARMPEDIRDRVDRLFANPDAQNNKIAASLTARGFQVSEFQVSRHRRGACACDRRAA